MGKCIGSKLMINYKFELGKLGNNHKLHLRDELTNMRMRRSSIGLMMNKFDILLDMIHKFGWMNLHRRS